MNKPMTKQAVATVEELTETRCRVIRVGEMEIGLLLVAGEVRAYRNLCPHAGAPLLDGPVNDGVAVCPWHGWAFDLRTGTHISNSRCTLDDYRAEIVAGTVFVWV